MRHIQVHGVALGSPLSSILTKILLSHHEKNYLNECPIEFKPTFNRKYVDDIFVLFESPESPSCFENIRLVKTRTLISALNIKKLSHFSF